MSNYLDIPLLNPVKFVKESPTFLEGTHIKHFDDDWFYNQLYSFQQSSKYFQKWQISDTIKLQVQTNLSPVRLDVIDCNQNLVASTGNLTPFNSAIVGLPYTTYMPTVGLSAIPEGVYWLVLYVGSGVDLLIAISEPQLVKYDMQNTILFRYRNLFNSFDLIFADAALNKISFDFRCEAVLQEFSPEVKTQVYEDQVLSLTTLNAKPFRNFKLVVGDARGVPDWVADKINRILSCQSVLLDGKSFVRGEGAKMERNGDPLYGMAGWRVELREGKNRYSYRIDGNIVPNRSVVVTYLLESRAFGAYNGAASTLSTQIIEVD